MPSNSNPSRTTGTAAGLAGAGVVIGSGVLHFFSGQELNPAMVAALTTIFTWVLGTYLHVPTQDTLEPDSVDVSVHASAAPASSPVSTAHSGFVR